MVMDPEFPETLILAPFILSFPMQARLGSCQGVQLQSPWFGYVEDTVSGKHILEKHLRIPYTSSYKAVCKPPEAPLQILANILNQLSHVQEAGKKLTVNQMVELEKGPALTPKDLANFAALFEQ